MLFFLLFISSFNSILLTSFFFSLSTFHWVYWNGPEKKDGSIRKSTSNVSFHTFTQWSTCGTMALLPKFDRRLIFDLTFGWIFHFHRSMNKNLQRKMPSTNLEQFGWINTAGLCLLHLILFIFFCLFTFFIQMVLNVNQIYTYINGYASFFLLLVSNMHKWNIYLNAVVRWFQHCCISNQHSAFWKN